MKKNYTIIMLLGVLSLFVSCSDSFLDKAPLSTITPDKYLWDVSQLASYSINLYSLLPSHSDNYNFGTFGIDADTDNQANYMYQNKYVPGQWKVPQNGGNWSFTDIYNCNYFLNNVVPRWKANQITGDVTQVKHYIGEMYFLRAWVYFGKLQAIGDFPIIKTVLRDNVEELTAASKRAPRSEVVRFILADLDSAITLMSVKSPDGVKNRLSQPCAKLIKSRIALYEATWLKYFKGTAFVPNGTNWPGAAKEYNKSYQFKAGSIDEEINWLLSEAMTSSQEVADNFPLVNNTGLLQQAASEAANPYYDMFCSVDMSGYSEVLLWRKYDKGLGVTDNVARWSASGNFGIGLTKGLVEGFLMANGLPIYASTSGYSGDEYISDVKKGRDGRLWLFLKEPGQKNLLFNVTLGSHSNPVEQYPGITNSDPVTKYTTGYAMRKGASFDGIHYDNMLGYVGSIVFRAAEAYLNYMEASYLKNGSVDGKARTYWTALRTRAKVDADFSRTIAATDMNKESLGDWGAYSAGNLVDPTLYNIRRERRCELMSEGLRDMDLKRWRSKDRLITTPYRIEGFKLWGSMQNWYKNASGNLTITYGTATATVSAPSLGLYLHPYEITGKELVINGYRWALAHYLEPIALQHFMITATNGDLATSPIYQNPGWPTTADMPPIGY